MLVGGNMKKNISKEKTVSYYDQKIEQVDKLKEPERTRRLNDLIKKRYMVDKRSDRLEEVIKIIKHYLCKGESDKECLDKLSDLICPPQD